MEPITRRRFLGQAGVALAGAAAGSRLRPALGGAGLSENSDVASGVVAPLAYSGGLPKCTLHLAIPSGPEADAHVALAPEFTKYSKGKGNHRGRTVRSHRPVRREVPHPHEGQVAGMGHCPGRPAGLPALGAKRLVDALYEVHEGPDPLQCQGLQLPRLLACSRRPDLVQRAGLQLHPRGERDVAVLPEGLVGKVRRRDCATAAWLVV